MSYNDVIKKKKLKSNTNLGCSYHYHMLVCDTHSKFKCTRCFTKKSIWCHHRVRYILFIGYHVQGTRNQLVLR